MICNLMKPLYLPYIFPIYIPYITPPISPIGAGSRNEGSLLRVQGVGLVLRPCNWVPKLQGHKTRVGYILGFPKIRGTILGVPRIRTVFGGLYWGPPIKGNYYILGLYEP